MQLPRPATDRWWLRPAAPLLAWCSSAEAEAAAGKDADLEGSGNGSREQGLDGNWSGGVDAAAEAEAAAGAGPGPDVQLPAETDLQPAEDQQQQGWLDHPPAARQGGLQGTAQEAAALARDAAAVAVGGAVVAIGATGAVAVEVVGAAVDAAGAAADYSRQQWERRSDAGVDAATAGLPPPPTAGPGSGGSGG